MEEIGDFTLTFLSGIEDAHITSPGHFVVVVSDRPDSVVGKHPTTLVSARPPSKVVSVRPSGKIANRGEVY